MLKNIESIVIVGGGTAGWMTAAYLSKAFKKNIQITLVESSNLTTIGVGEATFSTIKLFFDFLGLQESEWMPECKATYKMAIKFVNWNAQRRNFYHPFQRYDTVDGFDVSEWWLKMKKEQDAFDYSCFLIPSLCDNQKSPRYLNGKVFDEQVQKFFNQEENQQKNVLANLKVQYPYAYHFDAKLLARFLKNYAIDRGVKLIVDNVVEVGLTQFGSIDCIQTKNHGDISGDLFIDCTGFRGLSDQ